VKDASSAQEDDRPEDHRAEADLCGRKEVDREEDDDA
jgi:hypothetical protein